jgi:hypothetical protein
MEAASGDRALKACAATLPEGRAAHDRRGERFMAAPAQAGTMAAYSRHRLTPIERDALGFLGSLAVLLLAIWLGVSFGSTPDGGLGPLGIGLIALGYAVFAGSVLLWYFVARDEREPARGEFTVEDGHVREGSGSFRTKAPGPGVLEEPEYRMTQDASFVPRTVPRWAGWFALMAVALLAAGGLVMFAKQTADPLSPLLVAVGLLGGAVMLGALAVGEMGHQGPWARREERR